MLRPILLIGCIIALFALAWLAFDVMYVQAVDDLEWDEEHNRKPQREAALEKAIRVDEALKKRRH